MSNGENKTIRRFRVDPFWVLVLLIAVVAGTLGAWRSFRKPSLPSHWSTFAIPGTVATVSFPANPPAEADLSLFLIDPNGADAVERTQIVRDYERQIGTIRGWSHTAGDTRHAIKVHMPGKGFEEQAKTQLAEEFRSDMTFVSELTNLKLVEERRFVPEGKGGLTGRMILAERPDGNRVFVYVTHVEGRAIFLFVDGSDLTMEDESARLFFQSLRMAK